MSRGSDFCVVTGLDKAIPTFMALEHSNTPVRSPMAVALKDGCPEEPPSMVIVTFVIDGLSSGHPPSIVRRVRRAAAGRKYLAMFWGAPER